MNNTENGSALVTVHDYNFIIRNNNKDNWEWAVLGGERTIAAGREDITMLHTAVKKAGIAIKQDIYMNDSIPYVTA